MSLKLLAVHINIYHLFFVPFQDEEDKQQQKGVEIEKADQPNVTITPVHTENLTSHSASSPDAGTKVDMFVWESMFLYEFMVV